MDLVKIGFEVQAKGIKDANTEIDKVLDKAAKTAGKKISIDFAVGKSYKDVQKVLADIEKKKKDIATVKMSITVVGYAAAKQSLSKLVTLKSQVKDVKVSVTTKSTELTDLMNKLNSLKGKNANVGLAVTGMTELRNAIDLINKIKAKALAVSIVVSTKPLTDLKTKLDALKNKTITVKVNTSAKDIKDLTTALNGIPTANKNLKVSIKITPDLQVLKDYNTELQRLSTASNINSNVRLPRPSANNSSASRGDTGLFSNLANIAKFSILSTIVYALLNTMKNLAVSFVETADEMQNLTQRVALYTPKGIEVAEVFDRLSNSAKENRVALSDSGKLYTQLLPPIQRLKGGVSEALSVVDSFGKAMLIGGVNTKEAASATIQFGQAMASGKLAGDEFRSLAEASPRLLQAISDGAGIAAQKLKEMSAAGKLTSGLVGGALLDQTIQLQYEATKMGQTVAGAFNESLVEYQNFMKKVNESTSLTSTAVDMIRATTEGLKSAAEGFLEYMTDGESSFQELASLVQVIWEMFSGLVGTILKGWGLIIKLGEETKIWGFLFSLVRDTLITIVDTILFKIPAAIQLVGSGITQYMIAPFQAFIDLAAKGLEFAGLADAATQLKDFGKGTFGEANKAISKFAKTQEDVIFGQNLLQFGVKDQEKSTGNISSILEKLKAQNSSLVLQEVEKKAMSDKQYIVEYAKLLLQKEGVTVNAENLALVKQQIEETYKLTQEKAKELRIQGDLQAKRDAAEAKAKKAREDAAREKEQDLKRIESNRKGFIEELDYIDRVFKYKEAGVALDVAKVAAEKNYFEVWKNDAMAQETIRARQDLAKLEAMENLILEAKHQKTINDLVALGATYDAARAAVQEGYLADIEGRAYTEKAMSLELQAQAASLRDQAVQQVMINEAMRTGLTLEEATFKATRERIKALRGNDTKDGEYEKLQKANEFNRKLLENRLAETKALQDIEESTRQTLIYQNALTGSSLRHANALAKIRADNKGINTEDADKKAQGDTDVGVSQRRLSDQIMINSLLAGEDELIRGIRDSYPLISKVDERRLYQNAKIIDVMKEQAALAEEQRKKPIGDFGSVDFEVFGDLGNPFKSALDGLNQYLAGITSLEEKLGYVKQQQIDVNKAKDEFKGDKATAEYKELLNQSDALAKSESNYLKQKKNAQEEAWSQGLAFSKSFFKENSKGYKAINVLEQALQAKKIAFALWEKRDEIQTMAVKLWGYAKEGAAFVANAGVKIAAQMGVNLAKGTEAVLTQGSGDPYTAFARMAAMAAVVAGLGIAIGGVGSSSSGSYDSYENKGTGTVFGGAVDDTSKSIKNALEILSDNSELGLPISSAMLRSVQNIESSIGGVANLIVRKDTASGLASQFGFDAKLTGIIGKANDLFVKFTNKLEGLGLTNFGFGTSIISKIVGGLFGKTSSEVTAQGIAGGKQSLESILKGGMKLNEYADVVTTKKSWFSKKTNYSTQYGAADQELEDQFTLVFSNVYDSVLSASDALGRDLSGVANKLNNYIVNIGKINIKGLNGEQIQEQLEAVFGAESDKIAKEAVGGLDAFQKIGEGYYETLVRVAAGIDEAQYYADRLNITSIKYVDIIYKQGNVAAEMVRQSILAAEGTKRVAYGFYDLVNTFSGTAEEIVNFVGTLRELQDAIHATGKSGDYLTSTMITSAGGLDALSNGLEAYFEMLSPAEQAAELTRRLTNELAVFGVQLPADVKAFRALINSIDITTAAGQKLYGQVIALAPEFNDLQDSLEKANSEVNALVKSLRDLAEEAKKARGETQQPRNLAAIRSEFDSQAALAMQGDATAANKLLTLGKDLMQVSKQYSVTGSEYARDLAVVQRAATVSADVQDLGLGYTQNTSLTPLTSAGTQTVSTINSSTDAKLEALRADLVTAITAVAKYTQDTAQRLQRWDFGDKMNVRVEQEATDAPIKVKTV